MSKKFSLEEDLLKSQFMVEKCRNSNVYSQHLYASLCNNEFVKNEVFPILKGETWSCSWRYAGGILSDIRQEGDYLNWYCSGIKFDSSCDDEEFISWTKEKQEYYLEQKHYVNEGFVTDEIRKDLLQLGWIVIEDNA
jgi:hypothetical protein